MNTQPENKITDEMVLEFLMLTQCDSVVYLKTKWENFKSTHTSGLSEGGEWEIVSFKALEKTFSFDKDDVFYFHEGLSAGQPKSFYLTHPTKYSINSVRRKSDNEVFSVGDSVAYKPVMKFSWVIDNFHIRTDGELLARSKDNAHVEVVNSELVKAIIVQETK